MDIGAMARSLDATVELTRGGHPRDERAGPDLCRLSVQGDGVVELARGPFRSEGYTGRKVSLHAEPTAAEMRRLREFLAEIGRLQAREIAVEGRPAEHSPYPAWSFTVDALAAEVARADGIDLASCTRPATWMRTVERRQGALANVAQAWDWSREMHHVRGAVAANAEPGMGRVTNAELKGQRLVMRILNPKHSPVFLREEPRGMEVYVPGGMPDTMMAALKGRTVREVVGIDSDHVVTSAVPGGNGAEGMTVLRVKGRRVAVETPPADIDAWWLDAG